MKRSILFLLFLAAASFIVNGERVNVPKTVTPLVSTPKPKAPQREAAPLADKTKRIVPRVATSKKIVPASGPVNQNVGSGVSHKFLSLLKRNPVPVALGVAGTTYVAKKGYDAKQRVKRYRMRKARLATARPDGPTHRPYRTFLENADGEREFVNGMDELCRHIDFMLDKLEPQYANAFRWCVEQSLQAHRDGSSQDRANLEFFFFDLSRGAFKEFVELLADPLFDKNGWKGMDEPFVHAADVEPGTPQESVKEQKIQYMSRAEVLEALGVSEGQVAAAGSFAKFRATYLNKYHSDKGNTASNDMDVINQLLKQLRKTMV